MAQFAAGTTVSPEKSQAEIAETLRKYGATGYMYGWEDTKHLVAFKAHGRQLRFVVDMMSANDPQFLKTSSGQRRNKTQIEAAFEAEVRRRWRSFALAIKAKLEAVATGISTFEDEFLAYTVMPNGQTVSEALQSKIDEAYHLGRVPEGFFEALRKPSNGSRELEA